MPLSTGDKEVLPPPLLFFFSFLLGSGNEDGCFLFEWPYVFVLLLMNYYSIINSYSSCALFFFFKKNWRSFFQPSLMLVTLQVCQHIHQARRWMPS
jgi:predicted permease